MSAKSISKLDGLSQYQLPEICAESSRAKVLSLPWQFSYKRREFLLGCTSLNYYSFLDYCIHLQHISICIVKTVSNQQVIAHLLNLWRWKEMHVQQICCWMLSRGLWGQHIHQHWHIRVVGVGCDYVGAGLQLGTLEISSKSVLRTQRLLYIPTAESNRNSKKTLYWGSTCYLVQQKFQRVLLNICSCNRTCSSQSLDGGDEKQQSYAFKKKEQNQSLPTLKASLWESYLTANPSFPLLPLPSISSKRQTASDWPAQGKGLAGV